MPISGESKASRTESIIKTDCALCVHSCGIDVHVSDGRIVKVEGMSEHPISKGLLCPRGEAILEYVYSEDRLRYPMMKRDGAWSRISWDDALDTIAARLASLKEAHGAHALAVYCGSVGVENIELSAFAQRFRGVYGTPNFLSVESFCYHALITARILTFGRYLMEQPENAKYIILWGHNPDNSFPPRARRIREALDRGARIAVIDPRMTPLAERGIYMRPRPGTDTAIALAMINVIIHEEMYDEDFVRDWTVGFDELKEHVRPFTPEWAAEISGVSATDIQAVARSYAEAEAACIIQGTSSFDQQGNGMQTMRAFCILQAITGNVNKPGTWVRVPFLRLSDLRIPVQEEPIGVREYPLFHRIWDRTYPYGHALAFPKAVLEGEPYPVKALIVTGGNPAVTFPDTKTTRRVLESLDFLVVMDVFMSETAKMADIVLPASTFVERTGLAYTYGVDQGIPYVMLRKKAIEFAECWPEWRFWTELATRMGYQEYFPWKSDDEVVRYLLEPSGVTLEQLRDNPSGAYYDSFRYGTDRKLFLTPSGKVELFSNTLEEHGHEGLPVYKEPRVGPKRDPRLAEEYPLVLMIGNRMFEYTNSQFRHIPSLRDKAPEPVAEIHPETAQGFGVTDGGMMLVQTENGSIAVRARHTDSVGPGVVCILGVWPEASCNNLTDIAVRDPIMGYPDMRNLLCRVKPLC